MSVLANTQLLTILAQDPGVRINGRLVFAKVPVPAEVLAPGPCGHRVRVVDFDATSNRLFAAQEYDELPTQASRDPFGPIPDHASAKVWKRFEERLLANPGFHAQNAYAIAMRTLARFEFALGRRIEWAFPSHQLHVAPHAFCNPNAFYSRADHALMLGYFRGRSGAVVHTCLSHDIVAHETTHAVLDGLRDSFTQPSTPDQAGFHEGFSDVVALLSMFSLAPVIKACLTAGDVKRDRSRRRELIAESRVTQEALRDSVLFALAKQMGHELGEHGAGLRQSALLKPSTSYLNDPEWEDEHVRGEILVAAVLNAFIEIWCHRIEALGKFEGRYRNLESVVDEGAKVADHLLNIMIRAIDYCPPVDLEYGDYLAAVLTADSEVAPDDSRFNYRDVILKSFKAFGIEPPPRETDASGTWKRFEGIARFGRTHFEAMLRDKSEVFRFLWDNRDLFNIDPRGATQVRFVRPSTRIGPDGFVLRETVCEYVQRIQMFGAEVQAIMGFERPEGMPVTLSVTAFGGGTLIFDQYGQVKYHVTNPLSDKARQKARMTYLWETGALEKPTDARNRFSALHLARQFDRKI